MIQWLKDLTLSLLWLRFSPWPGNFHMPQAQPKKKVDYFEILTKNFTCEI